ncbi:MAG: RnfABCDGE type electron transport complex subunit B [Brevinematales bacterium]|nr:RnfABCDGE type electron transport complex subunit B [Brevinematales bacterium]
MTILYSTLIMLIISVFLGIMIAIFAKVFHVQLDPRIEKIQHALPGYNCGACGYPGCAGYADAIVEDKVPHSKCTPGGADVAAKILAILKESAGEAETA